MISALEREVRSRRRALAAALRREAVELMCGPRPLSERDFVVARLLDRADALDGGEVRVVPDHPHTDPGDGRTECERCGKFVWPAIHSCKGVPVTPAARARMGLS